MKLLDGKRLLSLLFGVFWLFSVPAMAVGADADEAKKGAIEVDDVVVAASRVEESLRMVTKSVTVITEADIKQKGRQSAIDVLNDVPGVVINSYGPPGGADYMYVRGAATGKPLILIDGVRVQNPGSTSNGLSLA